MKYWDWLASTQSRPSQWNSSPGRSSNSVSWRWHVFNSYDQIIHSGRINRAALLPKCGKNGLWKLIFCGSPGSAANSRIQELDYEREGTREVIPWKHFHFLPSTRKPIISVFISRQVFFTQKPVTFTVTALCFKHLSVSRFCHRPTEKLIVVSAHVNVLKL